jgi:hypothetical protein
MWLIRQAGSSEGWWVKVTSLKTAEQQSTIAPPTPEQKARGNPQEQIDALTSDITSRLAVDNQISALSKFRQDCVTWNSYVDQLPTAAKAEVCAPTDRQHAATRARKPPLRLVETL